MRAAKARDFPSLVTERILKPLRMTATHYGLDPKLVPGYDRGGRPTKPWTVSVLAGAGGLNSSARDMLAYIDANVGPARSPIEVSMRLAHQPNSLGYGASRVSGLGWGIRQKDGRTILHHSGGTGGYRAFIAMEPAASRGVIVMTNRSQFAGADNIAIDLMFPPESAKAPATAREGK